MYYFTNEKCIINIKPKFSEVRISQIDLQDWNKLQDSQFGTNLVLLWQAFIIVDTFQTSILNNYFLCKCRHGKIGLHLSYLNVSLQILKELRTLAAHQCLGNRKRYFWRVIWDLGGRCSVHLPLSPSTGAMWVHLGAPPFLPGESQLNL